MKTFTTSILRESRPNSFLYAGLGLIYFWFGMLKFISGLSPAEELAGTTIEKMTFGLIEPVWGLPLLAIWECGIGILLITGICRKCALLAAIIHITLTFTPLFLLPELCFTSFPFGLTLVGQYIIKNVVFFGIMLWLWKSEKGYKSGDSF
jgi:uncharacterized membrane protein YkgB